MKVLVIGESCTDVFIYGNCDRLSPEGPVAILKLKEIVENGGMASNVVRNLKAIDANVTITLWTNKKEIHKTRFVDKKSNHMFLRLDTDDELDPIVVDDEMWEELPNFDFVIVSDYNKGLLSDYLLEEIGKRSKLSILDSKRKLTQEIISSFSFVKLNEIESENNKDINDKSNILITLGSKGCKFKDELFPSPKPQETIDVSGAGDTFTSAFIISFFKTNDVSKSIVFANEMSSIVVSKRGVATP
jgi:D-beta-D-heptose 7-phosphate kinase/D-beta-D-heptose 1-phosphate adenosyltransferase